MEDTEDPNVQTIEATDAMAFILEVHAPTAFLMTQNLVSGCRSLYGDFDGISDFCQMLNFCNFAIRQNPSQPCREKPLFIKGLKNTIFSLLLQQLEDFISRHNLILRNTISFLLIHSPLRVI